MIRSLNELRGLDDLRISSLATHLADQEETIKELQDELTKDRKRITELYLLVDRLEELVEGA